MYNYEVAKGTVLRSRVDGKYYIVDSREDVNEYDWYFTVRQIASDISQEELIVCKIEDLSLSEKRIKLPDHQKSCFDMVRSVFPKLEGHYYAEDGKLMKDGRVVPRWTELSEAEKAIEEKESEEEVPDICYNCYKVLGVTDTSVVFLSGFSDGRRVIHSFHPYAGKHALKYAEGMCPSEDVDSIQDLYNVMEYSGIDAYGSYLYSDQKYLCVINERSHWNDERYWYCWEENPDLDDSIPDMTDIAVLGPHGGKVYSATYNYCFGKPVFSEGCFIMYQDNEDKSLYRVFSYKNGYPRLTEIHARGIIKTSVDPDNNAIFIRSAESLFYIPSDHRKELCLDSPNCELRKILRQLKGYDHVYGSEYSNCHYALYIANDEYKEKTFRVYGENFDNYKLY